MLTMLADGRKLSPYIIVKRKTKAREKPPNVILKSSREGMNGLFHGPGLDKVCVMKETRSITGPERHACFGLIPWPCYSRGEGFFTEGKDRLGDNTRWDDIPTASYGWGS
ncbi:hypothetical protein PR048_018410 [Dryococelus australis]|uniref:Uncharacterized protein n=1 Tax=Dryococelus australis TaxID=614101 RepID=A0ABQ9HCC7_9NEOP|nr:hypothetical protein PR048_018410 [Dryococelus australis]